MANPPLVPKYTSSKPLKFGILGAAAIAPAALILPARSHPDVIVYAVAARSRAKAEAFARKHGIEKAYEGYQGVIFWCTLNHSIKYFHTALLDDPDVDVVYNPVRFVLLCCTMTVTGTQINMHSYPMPCTMSGQ